MRKGHMFVSSVLSLRVSPQSIIFDEVDLTDASVAESSTKNVNNSFTVSPSSSGSGGLLRAVGAALR